MAIEITKTLERAVEKTRIYFMAVKKLGEEKGKPPEMVSVPLGSHTSKEPLKPHLP